MKTALNLLLLVFCAALADDVEKPSDLEGLHGVGNTGLLSSKKADIVFLVDGSINLGEDNFKQTLEFIQALTRQLFNEQDQLQIGLAHFATDVTDVFYLNTYKSKDDIISAIGRAEYKGGRRSNAGAAILHVQRNHFVELRGSRKADGVPQILLVVTGGRSSDDSRAAALALQRGGARIYAVGAGDGVEDELRSLASDPSMVARAATFQRLPELNEQILATLDDEVRIDKLCAGVGGAADDTSEAADVEPFLIFTTFNQLNKMNLDGSNHTVLKQDLEDGPGVLPVDLDFDYQQQMIYWSEVQTNISRIRRVHVDGGDVQVIHPYLTLPHGLAVDWVGRNLYWADNVQNAIYVSKLNGDYATVLVNTSLEEPSCLVVDVRYGYLYWTNAGSSHPHIGRVGMDGTNRTVIAQDDLHRPMSLTLDYANDRVYWSDGGTIEFANLDGTNRHTVLRWDEQIYRMAVFGEHVYWTGQRYVRYPRDTDTAIFRAHRTQGTNLTRHGTNLRRANGIQIYHPSQKPQVSAHPCQTNNGGCSNLCLLSPGGGYKCS